MNIKETAIVDILLSIGLLIKAIKENLSVTTTGIT